MQKELEQALFNKYPHWFKNKNNIQKSLMCFGFPGDGWYEIIAKLMEQIDEVLKPDDEFEIIQVKEKFGTLRFYFELRSNEFNFRLPEKFNYWTKYKIQFWLNKMRRKIGIRTRWEQINDLVSDAEEKTRMTCEVCGEEGKLRNNGWVRCLCEIHNLERDF